DNPHETLNGNGLVDSGCYRHMAGNKAYLVDYQGFNGGPVTFGGSKGSKKANNSAGTQDNLDAENYEMEADHAQRYYVLPLWSFYTSTVKSSKAKNRDKKLYKDTKTNEEPVDQEDQAFLEELERLQRQEKEANDAAETLRKTFAQNTEDLLFQAGAARANSTNYEPVDQEDQAFLEELERLQRQEKEANDAAETLRKTFAQNTEDLLFQAGAARANSTNYVNTAITSVNTASTPLNTTRTSTNQDDS
nr:hypothetical protein [Tanacetum cinerariifolium]